MVARFQINFAKELGSLELVKEVVNSRDQVPIPDYDFIKGSLIDTESPCPIFLLHQHNWTSIRRRDRLDVSFFKQFLNLAFDFLIF